MIPRRQDLSTGLERRGRISQPEGAKCSDFQKENMVLGCKLNVTPQHCRIIKQMVWEHVTESHACSRINSLNHIKPTSQ